MSDKISVKEYINNKELLTAIYIPFEEKLNIVSRVIRNVVDTIGGLNTSMLRRIATEVFIEAITNIDMSIQDENGLNGYDQLCYSGEFYELKERISSEYETFEEILDERIDDYIRTETNPAITINSIYSQVAEILGQGLELISKQIQNLDIEKTIESIKNLVPQKEGVENEGE